MMDRNQRWSLFKDRIQKELKLEEYEAWLEPLELVEVSSKKVIIAGIPHPVFRDEIAKNHDLLFRCLLNEIFPEYAPFNKKKIKYCIGVYRSTQKASIQAEFTFDESISASASTGTDFDKSSNPAERRPNEFEKIVPLNSNIHVDSLHSIFDPKHQLSKLVVGNFNKLAYEAGNRIVHAPGTQYNPFYIYGSLGLGKTHLLEAIGNAFQKVNPEANIIYTTAESFLNDFVTHLQQRKMSQFRQKYRRVEMFLIDNIQSIACAKSSQEELLHTIEVLQKNGKQIIISGNDLPRNIKNLDKNLCSRLESGLMADIIQPDLESRMAILQSRAKRDHIMLPPEVCYFIAQHIYSNIRKLEGALIRLGAHTSLLKEKITLDYAQANLTDLLEAPVCSQDTFENAVSTQVDKVLDKISVMSQVTRSDMSSSLRGEKIVRARQMSIYLLKELTNMSLAEIGQQFGNRTHSAIHNSVKQIKIKMEKDDMLRKQILSLKDNLLKEGDRPTDQNIPRRNAAQRNAAQRNAAQRNAASESQTTSDHAQRNAGMPDHAQVFTEAK